MNNELKLSAKRINPFLPTLTILLLGISTSISTGHFSFLFPFVLMLAVIFLILTIVSLVRSKTEDTIIKFDEIKSLNFHEYVVGPFKIKRSVINIKTSSKDLWLQSIGGKQDQEIYDNLKSKNPLL